MNKKQRTTVRFQRDLNELMKRVGPVGGDMGCSISNPHHMAVKDWWDFQGSYPDATVGQYVRHRLRSYLDSWVRPIVDRMKKEKLPANVLAIISDIELELLFCWAELGSKRPDIPAEENVDKFIQSVVRSHLDTWVRNPLNLVYGWSIGEPEATKGVKLYITAVAYGAGPTTITKI